MINYSWCDCDNVQELKSFCSPDLEYLTIKCWPYTSQYNYLQLWSQSCIFPLKPIPQLPSRNYTGLCGKLETTYPETVFIVAGDFNEANLRKTLLKFYQYIVQAGIKNSPGRKAVVYVSWLTTHGVIVIMYRNSSPFVHPTKNTSQSNADLITSEEYLWL